MAESPVAGSTAAGAAAKDSVVAIVTGAAGGLGSAAVAALADLGHRVAAFDLNPEGLQRISDANPEVLTVEVDVTSASSIEGAVEHVASRLGDPQILVNIAGTNRILSLADTTEEAWDLLIDLNLKGTFLCCRTVVPYMRKVGRGRIVNMASNFGLRPEAREVAYSASKAGVVGLTRALAFELAPDNITVNAIAPVMTLTPRVAGLPAEFKALQLSKIPLGRYGSVADTVNSILFLLSEGGSFYTGQVLSPNGGDNMA